MAIHPQNYKNLLCLATQLVCFLLLIMLATSWLILSKISLVVKILIDFLCSLQQTFFVKNRGVALFGYSFS